jgi:DNA polymerase III sliding clamp (beta) subunit (PCNA family)
LIATQVATQALYLSGFNEEIQISSTTDFKVKLSFAAIKRAKDFPAALISNQVVVSSQTEVLSEN